VSVNIESLRQPLVQCLGDKAPARLIDSLLSVMAIDGEADAGSTCTREQPESAKAGRGRPSTSKWEKVAKQLWALEPIAFALARSGDLDRSDAEAIFRFRMACARELARERFLGHINRSSPQVNQRIRLVSIAAQVAEQLELFGVRPIATGGSTYVRTLKVVLRWRAVTTETKFVSLAKAGLRQHRLRMSSWGRRGPTKHDLSRRQLRQRQRNAAANAK
jgi:hypothetical protein